MCLAINGPAITEYAYLDIGIGEECAGRVVLGLYGRDNPNTVQNFRGLGEGQLPHTVAISTPWGGLRLAEDLSEQAGGHMGSQPPMKTVSGTVGPPSMRSTATSSSWGGDIVNGDGTGGSALHGPTTYSENRNLQHSRGTISMIVDDNWEIRSQFFITAMVVPSLVKKCVAFGRVLSGMEVVDAVMRVRVDDQFRPLVKPRIIDCGTLTKEEALAPRPTHDRMLEGELSASSAGRGGPSTWQQQEQEQEQQRRKQQQQEQQQPQPL
ncbi:MAG: hypothetical protein WDW36_000771 [Sanguina aurantia]